jgi:hypothetical protein
MGYRAIMALLLYRLIIGWIGALWSGNTGGYSGTDGFREYI